MTGFDAAARELMLDASTFALQRRVNQPFGAVGRVVCNPWLLRGGTEITLATATAVLRLDRPFGVTFPVFGLEGASWSAPASIRTRHGRHVERVEVDLNVWDARATELVVRPRARRPYRWGARRMRRYFRLAHEAADALAGLLDADTAAGALPVREPAGSATSAV